jgi:hypothetical protein
MRKTFTVLLLLNLPVASSFAQAAGAQQSRPLVLTHVTMIDTGSAQAMPDATVVITGERITALGKSASVRAQPLRRALAQGGMAENGKANVC